MWTELMWTSPPAAPPNDLKVLWHSVVFVLHTFDIENKIVLRAVFLKLVFHLHCAITWPTQHLVAVRGERDRVHVTIGKIYNQQDAVSRTPTWCGRGTPSGSCLTSTRAPWPSCRSWRRGAGCCPCWTAGRSPLKRIIQHFDRWKTPNTQFYLTIEEWYENLTT